MNPDPKHQSLLDRHTLNSRSASVRDAQFNPEQDFFDPRDLIQVKYEMLRRVLVDGDPASHAARDFGFSRVAFYKALRAFEQQGLAGLLPRKRGPHGGHKITDEVLDFLTERHAADPSLSSRSMAALVAEHFDRSVHPRTITRAFAQKKKR
jgi:transposase